MSAPQAEVLREMAAGRRVLWHYAFGASWLDTGAVLRWEGQRNLCADGFALRRHQKAGEYGDIVLTDAGRQAVRDFDLAAVLCVLTTFRPEVISAESHLQAKVAAALATAGIRFEREARLGTRSRIDFLCAGGIGIEVKKGKPGSAAVNAQIERYLGHPQLSALVLVVERNVFKPITEAHGKPVRYVALNRQGGVAL